MDERGELSAIAKFSKKLGQQLAQRITAPVLANFVYMGTNSLASLRRRLMWELRNVYEDKIYRYLAP